MKSVKWKIWCFLLIMVFFVSSCGNDEEVLTTIDTSEVEAVNDVAIVENSLIHEWTDLLLELERYTRGRPNASARAMAYIYLAAYETAVPGMENYNSNEYRLKGLRIDDDELGEEINWELAINASFSTVLEHFLLGLTDERSSAIPALRTAQESVLSIGLTEDVIRDSNSWGEYVAQQVIAYSRTDVDAEEQILEPQPLSYEPPTGEGFWTYSADPERALFPYWESARTFVISPKKTTSVAPVEYSEDPGSEYYAQMLEAYTDNNEAKADNGEQLWIAEFWSDDVEGLMISPPVRQISIANQLIEQFEMTLEESLVMYLKLGFALNDAAVAAWKYKYEYMVMRPSVYIQNFIDPDFQTNLYRLIYWPNPGFPSYPSGHSCFASAAAGVFIESFGSDVVFTDRTHEGRVEFQGEPRTFTSFEEMAEENAFSRVPLGVHMEMDCTEGLRLGYEISDAINEMDLSSTKRSN